MSIEDISEQIADHVDALAPSVVRLGGRRGSVSGVIWSAEGLVVSVSHFLKKNKECEAELASGEVTKASLVAYDRATDLALFQLAQGGPYLVPEWVDASGVRVGQLVWTLGRSARGVRASMGLVGGLSGPWRTQMGGEIDRYIEVDGSLPMGSSGGPLFNAQGKLLGINSRMLLRAGATVPTQTVTRVLQQLQDHGTSQRGYLGVSVQAVALPGEVAAQEQQEQGLMILDVADESPAAQSGLMLGDVLLKFEGQALTQLQDLLGVLAHRGGASCALRFLRAGVTQEVDLTLGTR